MLIVAVYLLIVAIQAIRDFVIWYREGQEFANERKRAKALRQQQKLERQRMPALKERPADPSKPPPSRPGT